MLTDQLVAIMSAIAKNNPAPEVFVQATQSESKRMDNAALELVRGVYLREYYLSHFPPLDIDIKTGRIHSYNFSFAIDMLRKKKERFCHVDPEVSDATLKATMFFKFNSGTSGASLHALLGKTTELTHWGDVLNAMQILRHQRRFHQSTT
jgi:hypothetical protein